MCYKGIIFKRRGLEKHYKHLEIIFDKDSGIGVTETPSLWLNPLCLACLPGTPLLTFWESRTHKGQKPHEASRTSQGTHLRLKGPQVLSCLPLPLRALSQVQDIYSDTCQLSTLSSSAELLRDILIHGWASLITAERRPHGRTSSHDWTPHL